MKIKTRERPKRGNKTPNTRINIFKAKGKGSFEIGMHQSFFLNEMLTIKSGKKNFDRLVPL